MHTPGTVRIQNNLHISKSFHMSYAIFLFRREHILSPLSISLSKYVYIHTLTYINHAFITHTHTHNGRHRREKRERRRQGGSPGDSLAVNLAPERVRKQVLLR